MEKEDRVLIETLVREDEVEPLPVVVIETVHGCTRIVEIRFRGRRLPVSDATIFQLPHGIAGLRVTFPRFLLRAEEASNNVQHGNGSPDHGSQV